VLKFQNTDLVITSSIPGCSWGVRSLLIASAWNDNLNVAFIGTRVGQDDCVRNVILDEPSSVETINLSDCGLLTSLTIKSEGGTQNSGVSMTGNNLAVQMM